MRKKPFRYNFNVADAYYYALEKGMKINELTREELSQFDLKPRNFRSNCFCLATAGVCYQCNKPTAYLDRKHSVYVCSMECIHALDERYIQGEDFKQEKVWD